MGPDGGTIVPLVKVDMVWVIDNSTSMCQEQVALQEIVSDYVSMVQQNIASFDLRVAAINTNVLQTGEFLNSPAHDFPPACVEERPWPCLANADCEMGLGQGWTCDFDDDPEQMQNPNGSANSACMFGCHSDQDCCKEFCAKETCGDDLPCFEETCSPSAGTCAYQCRSPGEYYSGCQMPPDTADCPEAVPKFISVNLAQGQNEVDLFKCIATVYVAQSYAANKEEGLKMVWWALDPAGPNADQSASFLRPEAFLMVVFLSDEDDCSVDEAFAAPNAQCSTDKDCTKEIPLTHCKTDVRLSQVQGNAIKTCTGQIKKDYYNVCSLLGEYKGPEHHACAYDEACSDCAVDDDCEYGWYCKDVGYATKCRPKLVAFSTIASYQQPPGSPIFSLAPVSDFYSRLISLKEDPSQVLVAAIVGDATHNESKNTWVCSGPFGRADIGNRYITLAKMFGSNGVAANVCSPEETTAMVGTLAQQVFKAAFPQ